MTYLLDLVEIALMILVGGIGIVALNRMDNLLDEMHLLREMLNTRFPPPPKV